MKTPAIYPIYLSEAEAQRLVERHFNNEFRQELRWYGGKTVLSYSASVKETGEVDLLVHHDSDDGFVMSSGPLLRKVFRPYDDEQLAKIVARQKVELATKEYWRRQEEKDAVAIMAIHAEMFPT